LTDNVLTHSLAPKGTSLAETASVDVFCVKFDQGCGLQLYWRTQTALPTLSISYCTISNKVIILSVVMTLSVIITLSSVTDVTDAICVGAITGCSSFLLLVIVNFLGCRAKHLGKVCRGMAHTT